MDTQKSSALLNVFTKQVEESNRQLWQNQQQIAKSIDVIKEHLAVIHHVLNDNLNDMLRTVRVHIADTGVEGARKDALFVDWNWYANRYRADAAELKRKAELDRLTKLQEKVDDVVGYLDVANQGSLYPEDGKFGGVFGLKRFSDILASDEELSNAVRAEIAKRTDAQQRMGEEAGKLLDRSKEFAAVAGAAVEAIVDGGEERAQEAMGKLEEMVESEESALEGATIFGGGNDV